MPLYPVLAKVQLPPSPQKLLSRPRLLDFLTDYADVKLMAISASAGYGKTFLLIDYAHQAEMPVCWYTLDPFDRDPGAFFAHLLVSVRQQFPDFGQQSEAALASLENPARDWSTLAAAMINELYETVPDYFTIVLDDYHHIEDVVSINAFLGYLLQYSDEHCHLIIASRRLPRLPNQALLFGRGQMEGLGTEDLRFTAQEIQALVKKNFELDLASDKAVELVEHFEGWITGILLTSHTGWAELLEDSSHIQTKESIYDYLAEQVFADQPSDIQAFLLESAVLSRMSAEALDELREAGDSMDMLAQVGNRNLFLISLDDENRWFRYHQPFRDFLQSRLHREAREGFEALHRRGAKIFEARREWPEAFEHYAQAGDQEEVVRLFEVAAEELHATGRWDTLLRWIEALPAEVVETNPLVTYYQAVMLMEGGDPTSALRYASRAQHGFEARGDTLWAAWSLVLQATALRLRGDYAEALDLGQQGLSVATGLGVTRLLAESQRTLGITYHYVGVGGKATEHLGQALELYEGLGHVYEVAKLHHELGIAYRASGQWRKAVSYYRQAIHLWEQLNSLGHWAMTLNSVGVVHHLRGEFTEAFQALNQALEKAEKAGYRRMQAAVLASLGDLYRDAGQYQVALKTLRRSAELADEVGEGFISVYARQGLGETCRLLGDYEQANVWLSDAMEQAKAHGSFYEIGLCALARGALWIAAGSQARAWISLGQAEEFFERSGHLHELARAYFHLAHLALRQGRKQNVARHLDIVADLAHQLGYDSFLVVEGRQARPLLEYAASLNGDSGWWKGILTRASQPALPLAAEPKKEVPARLPLRICALGQDLVQYGSEETKTGRPKVRELFFYLLAYGSQGVRREQIMADFWPEASPSKAALSFRSALYRLRRLYADVRQKDSWYVLDLPEGSWYDVEAFESLLDEAQVTQAGTRQIRVYRQALALYNGDYLEGFDAPWCILERERLRERYRRGLHALADLCLAQGEYAESRDLYHRALTVDEFDEAACRGLIRSYAEAGQRTQALTLYHQFASHLYKEMGISPAPETEALYLELLRQDEMG